MRIGILSDIHDHVWNLQAALHWMNGAQGEQGVEALICCGDLCSPFIVGLLAEGLPERPIHIVFGNNDGDLFRISANAAKHEQVHLHGELFEAELDGKRVAANHYPTIALPLAHSAHYDVVCFGHNHQYEITRRGPTLL
ncbi:MAG: metallophosphatase family protein [Chloroflexota bacterium]|nr:metallophosphatase family protein [Chloroflexota bacterium]